MKEQTQLETEVSIDAFLAAAADTNQSAYRAGMILAALVDQDQAVYDKIRKRVPTFSISALATYEKIGRRKIHVPLLFDPSPAAQRLIHCPYEQQVKYSTEPVSVVVKLRDGRAAIERRPVHQAPPSVFDSTGVKSVERQLEEVAPIEPMEIIQTQERYTIHEDGSITFREPCTFSASQLAAIAERCKNRAVASLASKTS